MFVLPSVFSRLLVTKGRFPLVTVELTQARADPAPAREAPGTRGPGRWQGGHPTPGAPGAASTPQFCPQPEGPWASLLTLSPGTGPEHSRTLDLLVGVRETMRPLAGGPCGAALGQGCGLQPGCSLGPQGTRILGSSRTQGPEVTPGEVFVGEGDVCVRLAGKGSVTESARTDRGTGFQRVGLFEVKGSASQQVWPQERVRPPESSKAGVASWGGEAIGRAEEALEGGQKGVPDEL